MSDQLPPLSSTSQVAEFISKVGYPIFVNLVMGWVLYILGSEVVKSQVRFVDNHIEHMQRSDKVLEKISTRLDSMETRIEGKGK